MQAKFTSIFLALAAVAVRTVAGECQIPALGPDRLGSTKIGDVMEDKMMCMPQGEGVWTFSMYTSMVSLPTHGGDGGGAESPGTDAPWFNGIGGGANLYIFDHACRLKAIYDAWPQCGFKDGAVIKENFLNYVLILDSVVATVGAPYFSFRYANGKYSINNNHCDCVPDNSQGLRGVQKCKCAFPVNGEPAKRSIGFTPVNKNAFQSEE